MADFIDRQATINAIGLTTDAINFNPIYVDAQGNELVGVVRCKDCKHYNAGFECLKEGYGIEYPQDWFCADGERRSG